MIFQRFKLIFDIFYQHIWEHSFIMNLLSTFHQLTHVTDGHVKMVALVHKWETCLSADVLQDIQDDCVNSPHQVSIQIDWNMTS